MGIPSVSICIPTYRRPVELKRLLLQIAQSEKIGLEVIVCDDGAAIEGKIDFEEVVSRFPHLTFKYIANKQRLGFDKNLLETITHAKGDYIWLLGDDDEIQDGGIERLFEVIEENNPPDLIWVNFYVADSGFVPIRQSRDLVLDNPGPFLELIRNAAGFMSPFVLRRSLVNNALAVSGESVLSSGFLNLFLALYCFAEGKKFYFIATPFVRANPTPAGQAGYDGFTVFAVNFFNIVSMFVGRLPEHSLRKVLKKNFGHVWRGVIVGWLRGYDNPKGKVSTILRLYWKFPEAWIAIPLFMLPKCVAKSAYWFYKVILRKSFR